MTIQEPRGLMKDFETMAQTLGGMNTLGVITGTSGNISTDLLTSGESVITLTVDKLNEMLWQVVSNALANHLTPPITPTIIMPTPDTRAVSRVPGSRVIPVQSMPPPPMVPAVERSTRDDEDRVGRSFRATGVDESSSREEESEPQTNVHPEIAAKREMNVMKKKYEKMTNPTFKPVGSPFFEEILMDPLPGNFKTLTYEYDGTNDLHDHLLRFENGALLHQYTDGVKCRLFLTTLTKSAQQWFGQLHHNSIHSFSEFRIVFLHQFASASKQLKTSLSLMSLKQGPYESLRKYIGRQDNDFFKSLAKRPPKTFDELLDRADKYTNLEEARGVKKVEENGSTSKKE
ncbi:hypothetical protein ACS0TY_030743 [Phlomoides rotata]